MRLNEIKINKKSLKKAKRVGRGTGSGLGKTAGRGAKGQKSRSGVSINGFEGGQMPIYRRLPKRGFKNIFADKVQILNLSDLQLAIKNKKINLPNISEKDLIKLNIIKKNKGPAKLLGKGEFNSIVNLSISKASTTAINKIKQLGGNVELTMKIKEK